MAKVLVTGGAGFIGSNVVDALVGGGHSVVVVDNLSTGFRENLNPEARFYEGDIRDLARMEEIFQTERPEYVNHHAAQMDVRKSVEDPLFDAENNILGSLNLISLSAKLGLEKFVYISTGGAVYGEPTYLPVDEDHPVNPECQYGISKHTVEHYLYLYGLNGGLKSIILRYPNVYGPRQNPNGEAGVVAIFIGKMMEGESPVIFGDGRQCRDYVYVDDIVDANLRAMHSECTGIYNLGSGVGTSVNEIYGKLKEFLGFKGEHKPAPPRSGEIFKIYLKSVKASVDLGWSAETSLENGLKRTIKWFEAREGRGLE
jgi:UDP-glucose 4-epimerase